MKEENLNQENGITFSEIFSVLKKGWVLLVILLLVCLLCTTTILVGIREYMSTTNYETKITFTSASISNEDSFNPSTKVNSLVKSSKIVAQALTNCGYTTSQQQEMLKKGLVANLNAYTSESMTGTDGVAYPYVVVLSLKKDNNIKLSKGQSSALIEELTKLVIAELIDEYKIEMNFSQISKIDFNQYNYLQAYEKINIANNQMKTMLNAIDDSISNYEVNGISMKTCGEDLAAIKSELSNLKLKLKKNAITNSNALTTELDYATQQAQYYSDKATALNARIVEYATLLENIKPTITGITGTVSTEAINSYYKLVDKYIDLQDEYAEASEAAAEWIELQTNYSGTTSIDETIKDSFDSYVLEYNAIYEKLNTIITTYNEDTYSSNLVGETESVKTKNESPVSAVIIILCEIVVIALCLVFTYVIEKKKTKRNNEENK